MQRTVKYLLGIVAAAVLTGGFFYAFQDSKETSNVAQARTPITIGYRAHDLYAPLFVGIEQKIFEKHGLDVTPVKFESTNQLTDAMLAGNIDAALGGVNFPLLFTIEEKSPGEFKLFTLTADTEEAPLISLIVKKDAPYSTVADLKGKKIGAFPGSTAALVYRLTVAPYFRPDEATLSQMKAELELAALESGQVDAVIVLEPLTTTALHKGLAKPIEQGLFSKFFLKDAPNSTSIVSKKFIEKNLDAVKKLVEATNEAASFINTKPEETKKILPKYTPLEADIAQKIRLPRIQTLSKVDKAKLQALHDFLVEEKELKEKKDVGAMILDLNSLR